MNASPKHGSYTGLDTWSWIRILTAVVLIIGAYIWGVYAGADHHRGDDRPHDRVIKHENMMKKDMMPMMDHTMKSMDHMDMSMADMSKMLEGKTGDALDRAFLEGMIPHHQGAVDMARSLTNAKHPELRKMGEDIILAQNKEIEQMKKWMVEWGYTNTGNTNSGTINAQDEAMRSHCMVMPEMAGCEKYR